MRLCYPAAKGAIPLCAPGMVPAPWMAIPPIPGICPAPMAARLPFPAVFPGPMAPMPLPPFCMGEPGPEPGPWIAGAPKMEEVSAKLMPALEGVMPAIEGLMQVPALMMEYAEATGLLARWPELQAMLTPGREPDTVPRPADLPQEAPREPEKRHRGE